EQLATLKQRDLTLEAINLELQLDPDLPLTWADGGAIAQVLLSLLSNAQQALRLQDPPRQITICTALITLEQQLSLRMGVIDNGPGLPPEVAARLSASSPPPPSWRPRAGLGLAICQSIIKAHDGAIWNEPGPQGGTAIYVTLPLRMPPTSL
ncbi:MAG: ATP-binding protein, partial [Oscillochloridaceae bacterium umkhey_bin13]